MKRSPARSSRLYGSAALWAALGLGTLASMSAESVFRFEFNETAGNTVVNTAGTLTGQFGRVLDPANYPFVVEDSPSGQAGDKALTVVDPDGYLLIDAGGVNEFADFTQPITAEGWVKVPSTALLRAEAFVGFGASWKLGFRPDGQIAFTMFGVVDANSGFYFPGYDTWFHMAAVWEPGIGVRYFLDGVEIASFPETRAMRPPAHDWLAIGAAGTAEPINATIDRVRVHQAALTADQLDSVAGSPKAPLASTLASFNFDNTAAPFASAGKLTGEARPAQDVYQQDTSPVFTNESPSGRANDRALLLDGNDRIVVEDPAQTFMLTTGDFTIQAWLKPSTQIGAKGVFLFNSGPGGAVSAAITQDRRVMVTTLGIADTLTDAVVPNDGLWHHVAIVHRNGQDYRVYIDGVLASTTPYTGGVLMTRTDGSFFIGAESTGGLGFNGGLDRLELFNHAVPQSELDYLAIPGVDPGAPELEIGIAVSVAWPTVATGFVLQSTTDLAEPRQWTNVNAAPVVNGDNYLVLLPASDEETFFRLVRPTEE